MLRSLVTGRAFMKLLAIAFLAGMVTGAVHTFGALSVAGLEPGGAGVARLFGSGCRTKDR